MVVLPFAQNIVKHVGHLNIIYLQVLIESGRMVIYSLLTMSPPNYAYGLFAFEFIQWGLSWIAAISYGYKIAPANLAATMASIINTMEFILGKI